MASSFRLLRGVFRRFRFGRFRLYGFQVLAQPPGST